MEPTKKPTRRPSRHAPQSSASSSRKTTAPNATAKTVAPNAGAKGAASTSSARKTAAPPKEAASRKSLAPRPKRDTRAESEMPAARSTDTPKRRRESLMPVANHPSPTPVGRMAPLEVRLAEAEARALKSERAHERDVEELGRLLAKVSEQQQQSRAQDRRIAMLDEALAATKHEADSAMESLKDAQLRARTADARASEAGEQAERIATLEKELDDAEASFVDALADLEREQDRHRTAASELERLQAALAEVHAALEVERRGRQTREDDLAREIERLRATAEVPSVAQALAFDDAALAADGGIDASIDSMIDAAMDAIRTPAPFAVPPELAALRRSPMDAPMERFDARPTRSPTTSVRQAQIAAKRAELATIIAIVPYLLDDLKDRIEGSRGMIDEAGAMVDAIHLGEMQSGGHDDLEELGSAFEGMRTDVAATSDRLRLISERLGPTREKLEQTCARIEAVRVHEERTSILHDQALDETTRLVAALDALTATVGAYALGVPERPSMRHQRVAGKPPAPPRSKRGGG